VFAFMAGPHEQEANLTLATALLIIRLQDRIIQIYHNAGTVGPNEQEREEIEELIGQIQVLSPNAVGHPSSKS
jgi:hypothetical protein